MSCNVIFLCGAKSSVVLSRRPWFWNHTLICYSPVSSGNCYCGPDSLTAFRRSHFSWVIWRFNVRNCGRTSETSSLCLSALVETLNLSTCFWRIATSFSSNCSFAPALSTHWDAPVSGRTPVCAAEVESLSGLVRDVFKEDIYMMRWQLDLWSGRVKIRGFPGAGSWYTLHIEHY